jgi:hypothetical protein
MGLRYPHCGGHPRNAPDRSAAASVGVCSMASLAVRPGPGPRAHSNATMRNWIFRSPRKVFHSG